jgi:hypothetical protein
MRWLTRAQYANATRDLLGAAFPVTAELERDEDERDRLQVLSIATYHVSTSPTRGRVYPPVPVALTQAGVVAVARQGWANKCMLALRDGSDAEGALPTLKAPC